MLFIVWAVRRISVFVVTVIFVFVLAPGLCSAQSSLRTWHTASGGFSVDAEMIDVRDDKVQLKKNDGTLLWIEIDKLSLGDIRYVAEAMNKAREDLKNQLGKNQPNAAPQVTPAVTPAPKPEVPAESMEPVSEVTNRLPGWEVVSDAASFRSPFAGMQEVNLVLGRVSSSDLVFPAIPSAWMAIKKNSGGVYQCRVANIRTGKMLEPFSVDGYSSHIALSADGAFYAQGNGYPVKVTLYNTADGKKLHEINPSDLTSIHSLHFLSPEQLMMIGNGGRGGKAVIYDAITGNVSKVIELQDGSPSKMAVSQNGKLLAIKDHAATISIYDTKLGRKKADLVVVSVKENRYLQIDSMAFCRNGAELVVIGSSNVGELHAFSMDTGRVVAKHELSDRIQSLVAGYTSNVGPVIESYGEDKGWILYGAAIVDREQGGPVWVESRKSSDHTPLFRTMIDHDKQLSLVGDHSAFRFEIAPLPLSEISKSATIVANGGKAEDAGLPAITVVDGKSARLLSPEIVPQNYSGQLRKVEGHYESENIPVPNENGFISNVLFASDQKATCVAIPVPKEGQKKRAIVINMAQAMIEKEFETIAASFFHDLSPDGKWLATSTGRQNDRVDIYDVQEGKHAVAFRPFQNSDDRDRIVSIRFLNPSLLLTSHNQESIVWEFTSLKPLYRFKSFGSVFPFPSGERFLHRDETGWIVRRSDDGQAMGRLESSGGNIDGAQTASFLSDESACAILTSSEQQQKIIAWDLLTGKRRKEIVVSSIAAPVWTLSLDRNRQVTIYDSRTRKQSEEISIPTAESISWCNDHELLVQWTRRDQNRFADSSKVSPNVVSLVSLDESRILWDYRLPLGVVLKNLPQGQLWFVEFASAGHRLVGVDLPSKEALTQIAKAPQPKPLLKEGSTLALAVMVNLSGDKLADGILKDQVIAALTPKLSQANIEVGEQGSVKLSIEINQVVVSNGIAMQPIANLLASCRLTDISGKVLWQRDRLIDNKLAQANRPVLADDMRKKVWGNTLTWLKETIDPATMYEKWYYRGLGESFLSSSGEQLIQSATEGDGG